MLDFTVVQQCRTYHQIKFLALKIASMPLAIRVIFLGAAASWEGNYAYVCPGVGGVWAEVAYNFCHWKNSLAGLSKRQRLTIG